MSPYLREFCKNLFKSKLPVVGIALFLPFVVVLLPNSFFGSLIKISILISLIVIRGKNTPVKKHYRNIDKLLLPVSDKELFILSYLESFVSVFPFISWVVNTMYLFVLHEERVKPVSSPIMLLIVLGFAFLFAQLGISVKMAKDLGIEFNKIDSMKKILKLTRILGSYILFFGCLSVFLFLDQKYKSPFLFSLMFVLVILGGYFFYIVSARERTVFNEHKVYKNLSFRPLIDIPTSFIVIVMAVGTIYGFFITDNVDQRSPSSIQSIQSKSGDDK